MKKSETKEASQSTDLDCVLELASNSQAAAFIVDIPHRVVTFANTAAYEQFGINSGETLDSVEAMLENVPLADREYVKNCYQNIASKPSLFDIEFTFASSSRKNVWLSCSTCLFKDGEFVYVVLLDITRRKQHEGYLVEYGAKKNTLLDTLLHELNGALGLMNNLASHAEKSLGSTNTKSMENFISLVRSNSTHCINIIADLVREENTGAPEIYVRTSRADIVRIASYIFEERRKGNVDRNFVFETSAVSILVNTDEMKFLQIVNNLTSNALKFTRSGDEIRVSIREADEKVIVCVSDSGIGIPETIQPFVFDKYGAARRTGLNGEKSTGLGLSICKMLSQLIGGRLWFESTEGKGTSFFLELPRE